MLTRFRRRFSTAHVLAAMALFVALGGSAYALGKGTVGSKQIKKGAVKTKKLADGAVTTPKLAADAVDGAKVNEASLGKVPSAATADSATTATSATSATTAADADDAAALDGRGLTQVRGFATGTSDSSSQGLDDVNFEGVMTRSISIPTGGADLIADASVELVNNSGGQAGAQCRVQSDDVSISSTYTVTLAAGASAVISLTGFADNLGGTGVGDPENVDVDCQGSIADNVVSFTNGDLVVERVPSGS